jgi:hypothetical protein
VAGGGKQPSLEERIAEVRRVLGEITSEDLRATLTETLADLERQLANKPAELARHT